MIKIDNIPVHKDVTAERVVAAVEAAHTSLDDPGFCIYCGVEVESGIEPDARQYECESCGFPGVYGADELLFYIVEL
jgi:hypothetical protein